MTRLLTWWYRISLPPKNGPDTSPAQREHTRYAKLTSGFVLLTCILFAILGPNFVLAPAHDVATPLVALAMLSLLVCSWIFGRAGRQELSAISVVMYNFLPVTGYLITKPLNPSLVPLFNVLVIAIVMAGALLPPIAALITGALASIEVACIAIFQPQTATYTQMIKAGYVTLYVGLPIAIQIIVASLTYVIMRNLTQAIRRADRAEEIADLRQELMRQAQERASEQEQLENGIEIIAQVHARIANGDLNARVPLDTDHVLWKIAVPLNNLLNRIKAINDKALQFDQNK